MTTLHEVQRAFRRALIEGEDDRDVSALLAEGDATTERLAVHRNTLFVSLTEVLRDVFPAVCRLVDERFFAYAAHEFIRAFPPKRPCLDEYGARFSDFLAGFPPCRGLPYLADVARLEWLMNAAAHAEDVVPVGPAALAGMAAAALPGLRLRLHPALGLLHSPWPVDRLWRANRRDGDEKTALTLAGGGVRLEVTRRGDAVVMRRLDGGTFAFRHALLVGASLETAVTDALGTDSGFALAAALADLFAEGAVIAVSPGAETRPQS